MGDATQQMLLLIDTRHFSDATVVTSVACQRYRNDGFLDYVAKFTNSFSFVAHDSRSGVAVQNPSNLRWYAVRCHDQPTALVKQEADLDVETSIDSPSRRYRMRQGLLQGAAQRS